jgi:hypothetical protein
MYWGEVVDISQPLFPIGMKTPNSMEAASLARLKLCLRFPSRSLCVSAQSSKRHANGLSGDAETFPELVPAQKGYSPRKLH